MDNFLQQLDLLPDYLGHHMRITVIALAAGVMISLPVAVLVARWKPGRWPVLGVASVLQTIPSLALLALMVPLIAALKPVLDPIWELLSGSPISALGFWPAVIALTLYSMLPILRNTVTGIVSVDPAMTEAARGIGMTPLQTLVKVELPLAAPVIIAGIRTATVWVVGIATLSTPVGQTSLGNYIFSGLQTRNWTAVLFGCAAAAALAITLDVLIALLESAAEQRSRARAILAGTGLMLIVGGGLLAPTLVGLARPVSIAGAPLAPALSEPKSDILPPRHTRPIRVGSKTFTEQFILAALIGDRLRNAGYLVDDVQSLGSTVIFDALASNQIDVYVDYTGTIWANHMQRGDTASAWRVLDAVTGWLADTHGIRCLGPLGFENAYALAMPAQRARELNITTIADLAQHASGMTIAGDYEFFSRPEWLAVRDAYDLQFAHTASYDSTFMYHAAAQGRADVIAAFSSDGRIPAFDLTTLTDPLDALPPYDAILLLSPQAAEDPQIIAALRPLLGSVTIQRMRHANELVDIQGQTITQAGAWLAEQID